jgi:hypothetical protein
MKNKDNNSPVLPDMVYCQRFIKEKVEQVLWNNQERRDT